MSDCQWMLAGTLAILSLAILFGMLIDRPQAVFSEYFDEGLRRIFQWRSAIIITLLLGIVFTMVELNQFDLAYLCIGLSALWGLCVWLTSNSFRMERRALRKITKKAPSIVIIEDRYIRKFLVAFFAVALGTGLLVWFVRHSQVGYELKQLTGRLVPACDRISKCSPVKEGQYVLYFPDTDTAILIDFFPIVVIRTKNHGPLLTFDRDKQGYLIVIMDVRSPDNRLIVRLDEQGYAVNTNNTMPLVRPDRSTLVVEDQDGNQVLHIRYATQTLIEITGTLRIPGLAPFRIGQSIPWQGLCIDLPNRPKNLNTIFEINY